MRGGKTIAVRRAVRYAFLAVLSVLSAFCVYNGVRYPLQGDVRSLLGWPEIEIYACRVQDTVTGESVCLEVNLLPDADAAEALFVPLRRAGSIRASNGEEFRYVLQLEGGKGMPSSRAIPFRLEEQNEICYAVNGYAYRGSCWMTEEWLQEHWEELERKL